MKPMAFPAARVNDSVSSGRGSASGTLSEEVSATAQRAKGAAKDAAGSVLGLNRMEREGEIENATGRARQAANDVDLDGSDTRIGIPRTRHTAAVTWSPASTTARSMPAVLTTT